MYFPFPPFRIRLFAHLLYWIGGLLCSFLSLHYSGFNPADEPEPSLRNTSPTYALGFAVNRGQAGTDVRFHTDAAGHAVLFKDQGIDFYLQQTLENDSTLETRVQLTFEGSNPDVVPDGLDRLPGLLHIHQGPDPDRWLTHIPTYATVAYRHLYPGINLVYQQSDGVLKRTFHVAPFADLDVIRMHYAGADSIYIDRLGRLMIKTDLGVLTESRPYVYQEPGGREMPVDGSFRIQASGTVGFALGDYNRSLPLIIDPEIEFATYLGGSNPDGVADLTLDGPGHIYVTGTTLSADFPGAQTAVDPQGQVFVSKIDPVAGTLLYTTLIGGGMADFGLGIGVDPFGRAYVTGGTISPDFPTTDNAFQPTMNGTSDAFLTILDMDGSLEYSTYFGGRMDDQGNAVEVDSAGTATVAGTTQSPDIPTVNPLQADYGGNTDAFVFRLAGGIPLDGPPTFDLRYASYLGGAEMDQAFALDVDRQGNMYVGGFTQSIDFPTQGAIQPALADANGDGFLTKLSSEGTLDYSTYWGGSNQDLVFGVAADPFGNPFLSGRTSSTDFVTRNAVQANYGGGSADGFVTALNADADAVLYSTYIGGGGLDQLNDIDVDYESDAVTVGFSQGLDATVSSNKASDLPELPVVPDPKLARIGVHAKHLQDESGIIIDLNDNGELNDITEINSTDLVDIGSVEERGDKTITGGVVIGELDNDIITDDTIQGTEQGEGDGTIITIDREQGKPSLMLTKEVSNTIPLVGEEITYTITVENSGSGDAENVSASDLFDGNNFDFVSAIEGCRYGGLGDGSSLRSVACSIERLPPGGEVSFEVTLVVNSAHGVPNYARVVSDNHDEVTTGISVLSQPDFINVFLGAGNIVSSDQIDNYDIYINNTILGNDLNEGEATGFQEIELTGTTISLDGVDSQAPDNSSPDFSFLIDLYLMEGENPGLPENVALYVTDDPDGNPAPIVNRNALQVSPDPNKVSITFANGTSFIINLRFNEDLLSDITLPSFGDISNNIHLDADETFINDEFDTGNTSWEIDLTGKEGQALNALIVEGEGAGKVQQTLTLLIFDAEGNSVEATVTTAAEQEIPLPDRLTLLPNYPNPFQQTTQISYTLPSASAVQLCLYDVHGRLVRRLVDTRQAAGVYLTDWDGRDEVGLQVASGVYLYRLEAGDAVLSRSMLLVR